VEQLRYRRTQEERSTETRRRVLDAALVCLADLGYAGTTTTVVAERAGVSRGAQLHHFPTRASLVSGAVQHLFASLRDEYERTFAALPAGRKRVEAAIDLLWAVFQDPRLAAVLELYVAARTDPNLRAKLAPVAARHEEDVVRLARRLFPELAAASGRFEAALELALDALQGLAVRRLARPDEAATRRTLSLLKTMATSVLAEAGRGEE
jgi:AcrR family transcriptional regulator